MLVKLFLSAQCLVVMRFNNSTDITIPGPEILRLKCGSLRTAFLAFDLLFWLFTLFLLCQIAAHSGSPDLAVKARAVNDYFENNTVAFMSGPVLILGTLLYFVLGRKTISWQSGLLIDDEPKQLISYQFKQLMGGVPIIYLRTSGGLYILYSVTSEDVRKFPDLNIMKKEMAENRLRIELLKSELIVSAAIERRFWFFTRDVGFSFGAMVLALLITFFSH